MKKTGKQKRGVMGEDNATETVKVAKTSGKRIRDVIKVGTVAKCRCFASVHDVIYTVNINFIFVTNSFNRSVTMPINISCRPRSSLFHHIVSMNSSIQTKTTHMVTSTRHLNVFCQA